MLKTAGRALAIAAGVLLIVASGASATTTFTVNDTTGAALASPADTHCDSGASGSCTLRAAIHAADNLGGNVTINLPAGDLHVHDRGVIVRQSH